MNDGSIIPAVRTAREHAPAGGVRQITRRGVELPTAWSMPHMTLS